MMTKEVNPAMVELARKSHGWTQTKLAEMIGCYQGTISKIEQGILDVTEEMLDDLVEALGFPRSFFLQGGGIYTPGIIYNRSRKRIGKRVKEQIDALNNIHARVVHALLDAIELESERDIPQLTVEEFGSPSEAARVLREYWQVPRGPIDNITSLIERAGGIVVHVDVQTREFDGVYYPFPDLPPLIFVNKNLPGDRLRFTLAHELGHIVLHNRPKDIDLMEGETNEFAAEFMMPEEDIRPSLQSLSLPKLGNLKRYWKMAMGAILVRANTLGTITDRRYRYIWMQMGKAGYRKREPVELDISVEQPRLRDKLIEFHLDSLDYSVADLSAALHLNEEFFRQLYWGHNPKPRPIKLKSEDLLSEG